MTIKELINSLKKQQGIYGPHEPVYIHDGESSYHAIPPEGVKVKVFNGDELVYGDATPGRAIVIY